MTNRVATSSPLATCKFLTVKLNLGYLVVEWMGVGWVGVGVVGWVVVEWGEVGRGGVVG